VCALCFSDPTEPLLGALLSRQAPRIGSVAVAGRAAGFGAMAFFAGSSDRYMSVRDRAVQRQRDEESRVHSLRKFANDLTMAEVAVGRDDAVEAKRRKAEREAIEHEEMMEKMTRTVG